MSNFYVENSIFFIFASILLFSSLFMITSKSSVHSVLFLVLTFVCSSILLFLIECEFVSFLFLIIYVGAIAIFFLFVVMMLDVKVDEAPNKYINFFIFGFITTLFFVSEISLVSSDTFSFNPYYNDINFLNINYYLNWYYKIDYLSEVKVIRSNNIYFLRLTIFDIRFYIIISCNWSHIFNNYRYLYSF